MNRFLISALIAAALITGAGIPATAHHSFAAFDVTTQKTITGLVRQVDWTNPHVWIWIDVSNEKGGADTYGFEGIRREWPDYSAGQSSQPAF
jgi:hypothetical protein